MTQSGNFWIHTRTYSRSFGVTSLLLRNLLLTVLGCRSITTQFIYSYALFRVMASVGFSSHTCRCKFLQWTGVLTARFVFSCRPRAGI